MSSTQPTPSILLSPEERNELEQRAWSLRAQFREIPEPPAAAPKWQPDRPIAGEITPDQIIGVLWGHHLDTEGRHIERITGSLGGRTFAFDFAAIKMLDELAERWALLPSCLNLTTTESMRWRLMKWCALVFAESGEPVSCVDTVLADFQSELGQHAIWVQISGVEVEAPFRMGALELRSVTVADIEQWAHTQCPDPSDPKQLDGLRRKYVKSWQGRTAAIYHGLGDKAATIAAAIEHAERTCALLRVLGPGASNPTSRSFVQPISLFWQVRMREMLIDPQTRGGSILGQPAQMDAPSYGIPKTALPLLFERGQFAQAHELLSAPARSAFQERLLGALLIYARQRLTVDPIEKLIFTISAMETMLYADDPSARQGMLKRRLSGLLAPSEAQRTELFDVVAAAFGLRKQFLHHGHRVNDMRAVEAFLDVALLFFRRLLVQQREWESVGDFCQTMDVEYKSRFGDDASPARKR